MMSLEHGIPKVVGVLALLTSGGCGSSGAAVPNIAGISLNMRFDQTVMEVGRAHPTMQAVPYVGWWEEFSNSSLFRGASYEFSGEAPQVATARPVTGGRLRVIRLVAQRPALRDTLVGLLDRDFGKHVRGGCAKARTTNSEIQILIWDKAPLRVVGSVLVSYDSSTPLGPLNIALAPRHVEITDLVGPLRLTTCSRQSPGT